MDQVVDFSIKHFDHLNTRFSRNEKTVLAGLAVLTLYNFTLYLKSRRQTLNEPPIVAYNLPFVGHTPFMMWNHNKFIDWCTEKYGDIYTVNYMGKTLTIASGKAGEEALKSDRDELSLHHGVIIDILHMDYLHEDSVLQLGETVLPVLVKELLANPKMPSYLPSVQEGFARAKKDMLSSETAPTLIQDPNRFFQNFVAYMSVPTLVGPELKENMDIIRSFAECTGNSVKNTPLYILFPKVFHPLFKVFLHPAKEHIRIMEKYLQPIVHQYRRDPNLNHGHDSYIRTASLYRDKNGEWLPSYQVAHSILLVAFASVHTTSSNTSAVLYWLLARPELLKTLMEEIDTVLPNHASITSEALGKMPFLNNLLREVLRQKVSALGTRKKSMKDYTFYNGYQVPKGRIVQATSRQLNLGLNMNRIGVDAMDPSKSMERSVTSPARDFVSFGMGKHLCPGRFFATQEIKVALIEFLRNYDIKTASGKRPEPYKDFLGLNVRNCNDPLIFTPRVL